MRRLAAIFSIAILILTVSSLVTPTHADVLYSNIGNYSGLVLSNGSENTVSGDGITVLVADDITIAPPDAFSASITGFTFSVSNLNTTNVSARPRVRFYAADGASGGPGTYISGYTFNAISFTAGSVGLYTASVSAFTVTGATFWAGITFDNNNGATGATAAQLNNLGQGIFDPPTVGSSQDVFFVTNTAGSFVQNNPPGGFYNFGGNPVGNFGWAFTGTATVPEPSPMLLASLVGAAFAGVGWIRKGRPV